MKGSDTGGRDGLTLCGGSNVIKFYWNGWRAALDIRMYGRINVFKSVKSAWIHLGVFDIRFSWWGF